VRRFAGTTLVAAACLSCGGGEGPSPPTSPAAERRDLLVGAHYYLWFPHRFQGGQYLRARLDPAQKPMLGEYSSTATAVAERHITWAADHGIDFFTLDWWPGSADRNTVIDRFLAARNLGWIRFCIFYELGALGYDPELGAVRFDLARVDRFVADMNEIATRYFRHPAYLHVEGRPVIVLYITRTATGRFPEAMTRFRARMSELGLDPFVIGDEIYWAVEREDGGGDTSEPQRGRIALFDALTAYNPTTRRARRSAATAPRAPSSRSRTRSSSSTATWAGSRWCRSRCPATTTARSGPGRATTRSRASGPRARAKAASSPARSTTSRFRSSTSACACC
jgi:hypothetical protein